jgi:cephalosporin hydroxylase
VNPLEDWFEHTQGRQVHKWMHYFDIYHRHLKRFRGRAVKVVEFGVSLGGSAQMWREYFGPRAQLYGIDRDRRCKQWEAPWFQVFIGDQADRAFLHQVAQQIGRVDIVIDDGGHHPDQQIATFEEFYPLIKPGGVFLIEDLHTSYWPKYSGGLNKPGTFMEYSKQLLDQLNAYHSREPGFEVDRFTKTTRSMHFYDSVLVFEKGKVRPPTRKRQGTRDWEHAEVYDLPLSLRSRLRSAEVEASEHVKRVARRFVSKSK